MKHGYVRGPQRREGREGRPIVCTVGLASHAVLAVEDSRSRVGAALVPSAASARTCPRPRGGAVPDHRVLESHVKPPCRSRALAAVPRAPPTARALALATLPVDMCKQTIVVTFLPTSMYVTSKLEMFVWKLV